MLCRVPNIGHSIKSHFAKCRTRQRRLCRVSGIRQKDLFAKSQALGKAWHSAKAPSGNGRDPRQTLLSAPALALGKLFFLYIFWPPNFLCSPPTVLGTPCYNLVHFCGFLLYLVNLFHLIDFFRKIQI
jgi:hypothetical protein